MPAGDEKGLSKEILAARKKISEDSKKAKKLEKEEIDRRWKEQQRKNREAPPGDDHRESKEVRDARRKLTQQRENAKKQREIDIRNRSNDLSNLKTSLTKS